MRWPAKLLLLCAAAVFVAGCTGSDRPSDPADSSTGALLNLAQCDNLVGDRIWFDTDCDGIQDATETAGPAGLTVNLILCSTGATVATTTTDANGYYLFTDVAEANYKLCFETPDGYEWTNDDVGSDNKIDSDVGVDGCTGCFLIECDKPNPNMDGGLCEKEGEECPTLLGDRIWFDTNCNGIQDETELSGPAGLSVTLINCATGGTTATTTTDANGYYQFVDVPEANYKVCFELPDGYEWSPADQGADNKVDSDVGVDGCTGCFLLECDKPNLTVDAGLCEKKGEGEGCTPGFWRNHLNHWAATPYSPEMEVNDVFGCDLTPEGTTLGEAIDEPQTYGTLVFHAIAGLLNATHPDVDYDLSVGDVIDAACDGDKDTIADANESLCTLSGDNTTGGGNDAGRGNPGGGNGKTRQR